MGTLRSHLLELAALLALRARKGIEPSALGKPLHDHIDGFKAEQGTLFLIDRMSTNVPPFCRVLGPSTVSGCCWRAHISSSHSHIRRFPHRPLVGYSCFRQPARLFELNYRLKPGRSIRPLWVVHIPEPYDFPGVSTTHFRTCLKRQ